MRVRDIQLETSRKLMKMFCW